jgi:hypothetical protein
MLAASGSGAGENAAFVCAHRVGYSSVWFT